MKYAIAPLWPTRAGASDAVLRGAARAGRGQPRRRLHGTIGQIGVTVQADGGHYTLVTVETNQVGESEADKLAKRFLTLVHTMAEPTHRPIGAY